MAILKKGALGSFTGKLGGVVAYERDGETVVRSLPSVNKNRKLSRPEKINRQRIAAVSAFLRPLRWAIAFGYRGVRTKEKPIGAFQEAQSHLLRNSMDYHADATPYVNPEKVLVFQGPIACPRIIGLRREGRVIHLEWEPDLLGGSVICAVAYCIESGIAQFEESLAFTTAGSAEWDLSRMPERCKHVHVYVGIYNVGRGETSNSVYAGCV